MRSVGVRLLALALLFFVCVPGDPSTLANEKAAPEVKELKKLVKRAVLSGNEDELIRTLRSIGKIRHPNATKAVLDVARALPPSDEQYYWFLLAGAAGFKTPESCTELGDFIVAYREKSISRDLMNVLQQQPKKTKYYNRIVRRVLRWCEKETDLKLMAIDLSAQIPVRRTVDVLIDYYGKLDDNKRTRGYKMLKPRLILSLETLTRQRFGDSYPNWDGWWGANRHKGLKILRMEAEDEDVHTGVVQPLDPIRAREFGSETIPPGKVLVIKMQATKKGYAPNYDDIERVLGRLGVPCDVVERDRFMDFDIRGYVAIFINCAQINPFCQSPGHQSTGESVGNRLQRCGGSNCETFHGAWFCGNYNSGSERARHPGCSPENPALKKLKKFVKAGGYLFTEDWVLVEVLEPLWKKFIGIGPKIMENTTVKIKPARGQSSHPLLRGVFVAPLDIEDFEEEFEDEDDEEEFKGKYDPSQEDDPDDEKAGDGHTGIDPENLPEPEKLGDIEIEIVNHKWKIDKESHTIDVRSKKVRTLITSSDLKAKSGKGAVAVTFPYGKGRVLHVLSHFGKQNSVRDQATIENLLVNWLMELRIKTK